MYILRANRVKSKLFVSSAGYVGESKFRVICVKITLYDIPYSAHFFPVGIWRQSCLFSIHPSICGERWVALCQKDQFIVCLQMVGISYRFFRSECMDYPRTTRESRERMPTDSGQLEMGVENVATK